MRFKEKERDEFLKDAVKVDFINEEHNGGNHDYTMIFEKPDGKLFAVDGTNGYFAEILPKPRGQKSEDNEYMIVEVAKKERVVKETYYLDKDNKELLSGVSWVEID